MDIFTNIQAIAKSKGIALAKIEKDCGFGSNTMRKWAIHSPSIDKLIKVADYLGCSVDELIEGTKKEPVIDELKDQIVQAILSLPEDKLQRVRDFLAGISGS